MQRGSTNKPGTAAKVSSAAPEVTLESAAVWGKHATTTATNSKPAESPAPPPVWTRYIDSRLKQFCTR
jgi:hypothetical protein